MLDLELTITRMSEQTTASLRVELPSPYSSSWVGGSFEPGALPSKITPESDQTLQQFRQEHTFLCPDGIERLFSWHARYTPGDGRIFFFPDEGRRKIIIGHIENKLPTVMYPKG